MATQVTEFLTAKADAERVGEAVVEVKVLADTRTNQLVLIGEKPRVDETRKLIETLDVPLGLVTRVYTFEHVSAERIDGIIADSLDPESGKRLYRSSVDAEENTLIATTTEEIHKQIEMLRKTRDVRARRGQSPIRFYKVKKLPVTELLRTIRTIEQQAARPEEVSPGRLATPADGRIRVEQQPGILPANAPRTPTGPNEPPARPGQEAPPPPAYRGAEAQTETALPADVTAEPLGATSLLGRAQVTADVHTNTLIVIADDDAHIDFSVLLNYCWPGCLNPKTAFRRMKNTLAATVRFVVTVIPETFCKAMTRPKIFSRSFRLLGKENKPLSDGQLYLKKTGRTK
jgi:type II secretory pathway component GspD/PulD (secretin)